MRYQINHPNLDVQKWSNTDVTNLDNLIKELSYDEVMFRTSISSLESNNELKVLNLGRFRLDIENFSEIDPTIKILKEALKTQTDKK
ncbi:hypothetical protein ACQJ0G_18425 [Bacillus altitudinis]|uniref:hypothetical protein n=1 Tax=Bacillus altitudinis TaxID=293387 RepID=UPI0011B4D883|nr:hypothetical protein [Bacillus altitudinis]QDZ96657.1 hypothetical protein D0438_17390 [Bacillus altitudinis]